MWQTIPLKFNHRFAAHQVRAIQKCMALSGRGLLFHETGTGKTLTALGVFAEVANQLNRLPRTAIICPSAVVHQWEEEIKKHIKNQIKISAVPGGLSKKQKLDIVKYSKARVIIMNRESVLPGPVFDWLFAKSIELLILDEAHAFKNPDSKRTKQAMKLAVSSPRVICLTGTPIAQSVADLWPLIRMVAPFGPYPKLTEFRSTFCVDEYQHNPYVRYSKWHTREEKLPELLASIEPFTDWQKKGEVIDLPRVLTQTLYCPLSNEQKKFQTALFESLKENREATPATILMHLREVASGIGTMSDGEKVKLVCSKDRALTEYLEGLPKRAQVIIWVHFRSLYARISRLCKETGRTSALFTGTQTPRERIDALKSFKDKRTNILIANPASASEGLNLQNAAYRIYYTKSYSFVEQEQSKARNERRGSDIHRALYEVSLVTRDSIDERIEEVLRDKGDLNSLVAKLLKMAGFEDEVGESEGKRSTNSQCDVTTENLF